MKDKHALSIYLAYLPAIYQVVCSQPDNTFLGHYLKIFEKILSGINDKALHGRKGISQLLDPAIIGNLFYPQFSFLFPDNNNFIPPILYPGNTESILIELNSYLGITDADVNNQNFQNQVLDWLSEFLNWIASWIALVPAENWTVDTKRQIIAQMLSLYRIRGTLAGLQQLLNLLISLPSWVLQFTLIDSTITTGMACFATTQLSNFILRNNYEQGDPVIGGMLPWFFQANLYLDTSQPGEITASQLTMLLTNIRAVIEREKPLHCHYQLNVYPTMQLGETSDTKTSLLGINTFLLDTPPS